MASPTVNTIKVKAGECVILPGNAVITNAFTLGADPSVDSPDCPDLADAIQQVIDNINVVSARLELKDGNQRSVSFGSAPSTVAKDVTVRSARYLNGGKWEVYDVADVEVDDGVIVSGLFGLNVNTSGVKARWENTLKFTGTPLEGLIQVLSATYRTNGVASTITVDIKAPEYVIDNLYLNVEIAFFNDGSSYLQAKFNKI